jgi:protein required for attachment to host cells
MSKLQIPQNAVVFVGDGRKALFLRNDGDEKFPNLRTERVFEDHNPPTHAQGSDRPGRVHASVGGRRAGVEPTDWHELEENRFAHETAAALERMVRENGVAAIVIAAPPRTLAELRKSFHDDVKRRIVAEIDKDYTNHPVHEIEKHLLGS